MADSSILIKMPMNALLENQLKILDLKMMEKLSLQGSTPSPFTTSKSKTKRSLKLLILSWSKSEAKPTLSKALRKRNTKKTITMSVLKKTEGAASAALDPSNVREYGIK